MLCTAAVMGSLCSLGAAISAPNFAWPTRLHSAAAAGTAVDIDTDAAAVIGQPMQLQAKSFNLSDVRLINDADNHFAKAQELNTQFLKYLDADRLLYTFRTIARLPQAPGARPYGGWASPEGHDELVNGHFSGHFLSALAFTGASTGDPVILAKSSYMVGELVKCQAAICKNNASHCGYLSAYYFSQLEHVERHEDGTWATYYTLHKIMAGLLDTYENTGNVDALTIVVKMADFFKKRIDAVIASKGWGWWEECLEVEFGGMNEVAYNLFAITGTPTHKVLGDYFYKARIMDLLANGTEYALTGQHANTHLPEIIGVARAWELTGNKTLSNITQFFYRTLTDHYTYAATGGSNEGEHWLYPDMLGTAVATIPGEDSAGYHTEESCTQYNVLKILRHLFKWAPSAALGDDYEHKINNGVIGIQKPGNVGEMVYMTPLGNGVARPKANWGEGWGSANNSFWCCYGTAVESFGKLGDSIYFYDDAAGAEQLWIVQYVSSVVRWRDAGVNVTQAVRYTRAGGAVSMAVKITVGELAGGYVTSAAVYTINLRIPGWAVVATSSIELNGQAVVKPGAGKAGTFLRVKAAFKPGDVITATFGMEAHWAKLNDNRTAYDTMGSVQYGPYALVALTAGNYSLKADLKNMNSWLTLSPGSDRMEFTATGNDGRTMTLVPLSSVVDETYSVHLNVSANATQCLCGEADKCSAGAGTTAAGTATLSFDAESLVAVGGAALEGSTVIRSGSPGQATAVLMKSPFVGKGVITGVDLSFKYTIGYSSKVEPKGTKGATMALAYHPSLASECPSTAADPGAEMLWTSPPYLEPKFDITHTYSAPVHVSLSGLHLDVSAPGARLGLSFTDNDHNMQVLLPITVKLTWAEEHHGHVH